MHSASLKNDDEKEGPLDQARLQELASADRSHRMHVEGAERTAGDSLWGRVVSGEDPPEDGVHPLPVVVAAAAEAAQRVLKQVRHGQRAELLLHCSQHKLLE